MTGQDIIDHFQWLVDDENVDETRELVLLNRAYYRLCSKRIWNFLKAVDESQTITASTKTYDCPTDTMVLLQNNWYKDSLGNYSEKNKVSFQSRLKYATSTKYYWYDKKNNKFALTRNPTDSEVGNTLVLEVEESGQFGLYLDDNIFIDDDVKILATYLMRNNGDLIGKARPLTKAQWDKCDKYNLRREKI